VTTLRTDLGSLVNANGLLGVGNALESVRSDRVTVPPPYESWEPAEPMDPKDLPPGFYFPPGSEPGGSHQRAPGPVWMLVVIGVVVVLVIAFAAFLLL
jgi:hypothetical protein